MGKDSSEKVNGLKVDKCLVRDSVEWAAMSLVWCDDGQGSSEVWWKNKNHEIINQGSGNVDALIHL